MQLNNIPAVLAFMPKQSVAAESQLKLYAKGRAPVLLKLAQDFVNGAPNEVADAPHLHHGTVTT